MNRRTPIISVSDFSMNFGKKNVIKNLSFDVYKGEVFGFLGSNGSGKTTTIRALLGLYEPSSGKLHINRSPFDPKHNSSTLGYLPEERGLYKKEKTLDIMIYFGQLKGMSKKSAKDWSLNYLNRVGLEDLAESRLDKLSGGQQQKVQLGVTIMNNPDILILDEPTKGFDPVNRRLLMDIVREHQQNGATIVFITHQMEEVEKLCDRIILLKDGSAHAYGTISAVRKKFGGKSLDDIFVSVYKNQGDGGDSDA